MSDKILTFKQYQEIGREIVAAMEEHFTESPGLSYSSAWVDNLLVRFTNKINHEIIIKYAREPE